VEDNVADLLLLMKFLKESTVKNHVNVVRDGQAAMQYLNRVKGFETSPRPDLILLDLTLPLMDGMEVLIAVKENPQLSAIPIIILTATDSLEMVSRAYECKADYYMVKPQNLDQLSHSIKYLEEFWFEKLATVPSKDSVVVSPAVGSSTQRSSVMNPKPKASSPVMVFMVEENMADMVLIEEALKVHSRSIELTLAKDRTEAINFLNRFEGFDRPLLPDVILLDLSQGNKTGFEFLAMIRSVSALDQVPLVLLTNSDLDQDIRRAYDEPSNFYIKKPHHSDQLFATIHHVVHSSR
jgi:CheY-like chemotaxis protein